MNADAMAGARRQAKVIRLRAEGLSWGEIADLLGYAGPSGAKQAFRQGVRRSKYRECLLAIFLERLERLDDWLVSVEAALPHHQRREHELLREWIFTLLLRIEDALDGERSPAGIGDMKRHLRLRNPQPIEDISEAELRLMKLRGVDGRLDDLQGEAGVDTRSGTYKALDRTVRRYLLAAVADLYAPQTERARDAWHELELERRRSHHDLGNVMRQLVRLQWVLETTGALPRQAVHKFTRADSGPSGYRHRVS